MALNAKFAMTRPQAPLVVAGGIAAKDWFVWFYNVYLASTQGLSQPEESITVTASPVDYQAVIKGQVFISGGSGLTLSFSRDGTTYYNVGNQRVILMNTGDYIRLAYATIPTMVFMPM